jgi:hypothetical protein
MSACQNQTVLPASPPAAARLPQVPLGCHPPGQACGSTKSTTHLLSASWEIVRMGLGCVYVSVMEGAWQALWCGAHGGAGAELCNMEGDDMDNACHPLSTMHCVMVCYWM